LGGDTLSPLPTALGAFNNSNSKSATISGRFISFILTVKQSAALAPVLRATTKRGRQLFEEKSAFGDLA